VKNNSFRCDLGLLKVPHVTQQSETSLRHANATYLLNSGASLKVVGDHLGHRSLSTTQVYAKVDLVGLREVAAFDLGGLL
jgi:site-specific recombinase XerD